MRTVKIDIINDKAMDLLKNLALLKLIRLHTESPATNQNTDWLNFSGAMSKDALKNVDQQLSELRSEWE